MSLACPSIIADNFPHLCAPLDLYCERTSTAFDAEPINAVSNAAFLVAAWCAWRLLAARPAAGAAGQIRVLIVITALVGPGSATFHTIGTAWAVWADVLPILVFMLLYLWIALRRFFGWPAWAALAAVLAFFLATFYLEAFVPSTVLWGGAMYLPTLAALVLVGLVLARRRPDTGRRILAGTGVLLVAFVARMLDMPTCAYTTIGTHFLWHMLVALVLYLMTRAAILDAAPRRAAAAA